MATSSDSLLAWPDVFRDAVGRLFATVARA
jgi:hypothetical protein